MFVCVFLLAVLYVNIHFGKQVIGMGNGQQVRAVLVGDADPIPERPPARVPSSSPSLTTVSPDRSSLIFFTACWGGSLPHHLIASLLSRQTTPVQFVLAADRASFDAWVSSQGQEKERGDPTSEWSKLTPEMLDRVVVVQARLLDERSSDTLHPSVLRYQVARDFCVGRGGWDRSWTGRRGLRLALGADEASGLCHHATHLVVADGGDVLVQRSIPLHTIPTDRVIFSLEAGKAIRDQQHNAHWIRTLSESPSYDGEAMLAEFGHETISCSGVTVGGRGPMVEYLEAMVHLGESLPVVKDALGLDQGMHNFLLYHVWTRESPRVLILSHLESPVYTAGFVGFGDYQLDINGDLVHCRGTPPIIHQVNRQPAAWTFMITMLEKRMVQHMSYKQYEEEVEERMAENSRASAPLSVVCATAFDRREWCFLPGFDSVGMQACPADAKLPSLELAPPVPSDGER